MPAIGSRAVRRRSLVRHATALGVLLTGLCAAAPGVVEAHQLQAWDQQNETWTFTPGTLNHFTMRVKPELSTLLVLENILLTLTPACGHAVAKYIDWVGNLAPDAEGWYIGTPQAPTTFILDGHNGPYTARFDAWVYNWFTGMWSFEHLGDLGFTFTLQNFDYHRFIGDDSIRSPSESLAGVSLYRRDQLGLPAVNLTVGSRLQGFEYAPPHPESRNDYDVTINVRDLFGSLIYGIGPHSGPTHAQRINQAHPDSRDPVALGYPHGWLTFGIAHRPVPSERGYLEGLSQHVWPSKISAAVTGVTVPLPDLRSLRVDFDGWLNTDRAPSLPLAAHHLRVLHPDANQADLENLLNTGSEWGHGSRHGLEVTCWYGGEYLFAMTALDGCGAYYRNHADRRIPPRATRLYVPTVVSMAGAWFGVGWQVGAVQEAYNQSAHISAPGTTNRVIFAQALYPYNHYEANAQPRSKLWDALNRGDFVFLFSHGTGSVFETADEPLTIADWDAPPPGTRFGTPALAVLAGCETGSPAGAASCAPGLHPPAWQNQPLPIAAHPAIYGATCSVGFVVPVLVNFLVVNLAAEYSRELFHRFFYEGKSLKTALDETRDHMEAAWGWVGAGWDQQVYWAAAGVNLDTVYAVHRSQLASTTYYQRDGMAMAD